MTVEELFYTPSIGPQQHFVEKSDEDEDLVTSIDKDWIEQRLKNEHLEKKKAMQN